MFYIPAESSCMCFHMCSCSSSFMAAPSGHFVSPHTTSRCGVWQKEILNSTSEFGSKHPWLQSCGHLRSLGSSRLIFLKLLAVAQSFVFLGIGDQPSFVSWLWEFPQGDLLRRSCVNSCAAMLPCSIPPWMGLRFSTQHSLKTIKSSMYGSSCGSVPKPFAFLKGLSKSGPLRWMCWF